MKRVSSKRRGVAHVSDAKFSSLYEEADDDVAEELEVEGDDEAPMETWRMSSSKLGVKHHQQQQQQKMFVCNKCGKGFQSSKALCGHMACHSLKAKASTLSNQKRLVIMDGQSDTKSGAKNLRRRSWRARYKKIDRDADSRTKLDAYYNCSYGVSGIEQEQEEVAICLMMLSRDSANWGGLNSIGDSSENNSVVLEARSVSTILVKKDGLSRDGEGCSQAERPKTELYSRMSAVNGSYNVENQYSNAEMYRMQNALNRKSFTMASSTYESVENSFETDGLPDVTKGKGIVEHHSSNVGDNQKMRKHECPTCFKVFRSVHALGGHRRVHLAKRSADISKGDEIAAIFKQNGIHIHNFIDLNMPAPMEDEEANEFMGS